MSRKKMQPHEIHPSPITGSNGSTTDLQAARIKNQRRISAVLPTISLMVYQPQDFTGSTSKRSKLMGRWIAALPSRPVHNTVQVYQSTRNTRLIRLHSNARPCALPLMMEGCSAIPLRSAVAVLKLSHRPLPLRAFNVLHLCKLLSV